MLWRGTGGGKRVVVPSLWNCCLGLVRASAESEGSYKLTVCWLQKVLEADSVPGLAGSSQIHLVVLF